MFWELGVGYNTLGIIKYSFWQMTQNFPLATYVCRNLEDSTLDIAGRSIGISGDIGTILHKLNPKTTTHGGNL